MLWNGLRQSAPEAGLARRVARERAQRVRREAVARERAREVAAALAQPRVQRVRVLDVLLDDVVVELARARCRARGRRRSVRGRSGSRPGLAARRARARCSTSGNGERRGPARPSRARGLARALRAGRRGRASSARRRRAVEAADADVDGMDLAPADDRHQRVAGLLHLQPLLDDLAVVGAPSRSRPGSRGSRARAACRRAGRGSRSTRRSR